MTNYIVKTCPLIKLEFLRRRKMEPNYRVLVLKVNEKEKEMVHQKWAFNWFLDFRRVSDNCIAAGSLFHDAGPATASTWSPKFVFKRWTWRSPCVAERNWERAASSAFERQSSLSEIFRCSAMDSFEDQKTEFVPDSLRHAQPTKSIAQQTRYGCQPTRVADKSRCCIHHSLELIHSTL